MAAFIGILYIFDMKVSKSQQITFMDPFSINLSQTYTRDSTTILILLMAMALYGWTAIPLTYWFSFLFTSAPKGFTLIVMYNIITGMIGTIAVPIIQQTADVYTAFDWSVILSFLFPTYSISNVFAVVYDNEFGRQACEMLDCSNPLYKQSIQCCGQSDGEIDNIT
ncbi:hypothetical protein KIN20_026005 [Parelaphostrongylus tenuis]|uniref:Uncharacterized protein n=1 Tax=Parelaphostrongylus tenuis TaxID=148309 RepID=A0AAD5QXV1_PARTN|nr:hypothetical protein KIN20_026005 [Parelaphostrongylus tenuis]